MTITHHLEGWRLAQRRGALLLLAVGLDGGPACAHDPGVGSKLRSASAGSSGAAGASRPPTRHAPGCPNLSFRFFEYRRHRKVAMKSNKIGSTFAPYVRLILLSTIEHEVTTSWTDATPGRPIPCSTVDIQANCPSLVSIS